MILINIYKYIIEEISFSLEFNMKIIELFGYVILAIFATIPALLIDIILAPIELITLIVYKILKKKRRK